MTLDNSLPTSVELQILRILWEHGPSPVRVIHSRLHAEKGTNYSTTVKMLSVMLEKQLVTRDENCSPMVYRAAMTRGIAGRRMIRNLVEKVYDGVAMNLVVHALKESKPTDKELEAVRKLLDEMEKRK